MILPPASNSFTIQQLQIEKQTARAGSLTLWPSRNARSAAGVQATRRRRLVRLRLCADSFKGPRFFVFRRLSKTR
jgi:hypothetical protein